MDAADHAEELEQQQRDRSLAKLRAQTQDTQNELRDNVGNVYCQCCTGIIPKPRVNVLRENGVAALRCAECQTEFEKRLRLYAH